MAVQHAIEVGSLTQRERRAHVDLARCLREGDLRPLRHPTERSRYYLAMATLCSISGGLAISIFAAGGLVELGVGAMVVVLATAMVWITIQVVRARLLGNGVRVTEESLPELQRIVQQVRRALDYHRPVDIYVLENAKPSASLTSYLGQRVIVLEGSLVAELMEAGHRAELTFLIARFVGALKVRHSRFTPALVVLQYLQALKFVNPLVMPYERATAYSGDQIGLACCRDLAPSLGVINRLLVGKSLAPQLAVPGILNQAAEVRRRPLPRLAQLFLAEPHLTNRFLNLLAFATVTEAPGLARFEGTLPAPAPDSWRNAIRPWEREPRGVRRALAPVLACLATALVLGLAALWAHSAQFSSAVSPSPGAAPTTSANGPVNPPATPSTPQSSTSTLEPAVAYVEGVSSFLSRSHQDVQVIGAAIQQASSSPSTSTLQIEQVVGDRRTELTLLTQTTPPAAARNAHALLVQALQLSLTSDQFYLRWAQDQAAGDTADASVAYAAAQANDPAATRAKRAFLIAYNRLLQQLGAQALPLTFVF